MRDAIFLRVPNFPTSGKEIESQIVDPSGEQQPAVGEKGGDGAQGAESARRFTPVSEYQSRIDDSEE
jgi:hypothetical protein